MKAVLTLLLLAGCADVSRFEFVKAQSLVEVRGDRNCGQSVLPTFGCWRQLDMRGGCRIIVEWPKHSDDANRLRTLGLEVWKCVEGNRDY